MTVGLELGGSWYLLMRSAHPLRESLGQSVFAEAHTPDIMYYKAGSTKIFLFTFKNLCYIFLGSIYLFLKLAEQEN